MTAQQCEALLVAAREVARAKRSHDEAFERADVSLADYFAAEEKFCSAADALAEVVGAIDGETSDGRP